MIPSQHGLREIIRDIASRRNRKWQGVAFLFIVSLLIWKDQHRPHEEPDTIDYHYNQWLHNKRNLVWGISTNRLSVKKAVWYLDGKPTFEERMEQIHRHELALIRLNHFADVTFNSKGADISQLLSDFTQRATKSEIEDRWSTYVTYNPETNINFTARRQDLPILTSLFQESMHSITNRLRK